MFYTRQLILPLLVTVYQMLECSAMNILPMSELERGTVRRKEWDAVLEGEEDEDWCIFALDVQNTYGLPFEVTLTFDESSESIYQTLLTVTDHCHCQHRLRALSHQARRTSKSYQHQRRQTDSD